GSFAHEPRPGRDAACANQGVVEGRIDGRQNAGFERLPVEVEEHFLSLLQPASLEQARAALVAGSVLQAGDLGERQAHVRERALKIGLLLVLDKGKKRPAKKRS